jgi:CheY-like chemotaxis protein
VDKSQAEKAQANINGIFAGHRILLVEDVDINREIVIALLEPTQLEIDCAENGVEAVQMFSEAPHKYEMIFMDIQMPEMDGYEATRSIRAFEAKENNGHLPQEREKGVPQERVQGVPKERVPIIAMTANVFREDVERCLNAGMNDHVGKPIDFNEVLEKLRNYLL